MSTLPVPGEAEVIVRRIDEARHSLDEARHSFNEVLVGKLDKDIRTNAGRRRSHSEARHSLDEALVTK